MMADRQAGRRTARWWAAMVVVVVMAAGCGTPSDQAEPEPIEAPEPVESDSELPFGDSDDVDAGDDALIDPDAPTPPAVAAEATPTAADVNRVLDSESGLVELSSVDLLAIDIAEPDVVVVAFEMESHHCYGITTSVRESETEVEVEVLRGRRSTSAPGDCAHGAFPYTARFELAAPVGARTVVSAERREPPDPGVLDEPGPAASATPAVAADEAEATEEDVAGAGGSQEWLLGLHVEDGVEWAIDHGLEWRVISFDGETVASDGDERPDRIAFVVERDLIVAYEWS